MIRGSERYGRIVAEPVYLFEEREEDV